jgi:hypothetical protein
MFVAVALHWFTLLAFEQLCDELHILCSRLLGVQAASGLAQQRKQQL